MGTVRHLNQWLLTLAEQPGKEWFNIVSTGERLDAKPIPIQLLNTAALVTTPAALYDQSPLNIRTVVICVFNCMGNESGLIPRPSYSEFSFLCVRAT